MTDHMNEAKRLAQAYADAVLLGEGNDEALAALLAHIQRGAVPDVGWLSNVIRAADGSHRLGAGALAEKIVDAMLAAAPDHFRDAAEMVAEPAADRIAAALHYPECWDTAAYPTVESALAEVYAHYRCTEHDAPTDVPMPEAVCAQHRFRHPQKTTPDWSPWQPTNVKNRPAWEIDSVGYEVEYRDLFTADQMRTYGAACRAAGYARAANWLRAKAEKHAEENGYHEPDTGSFVFAGREAEEWNNSVLELADEMEAALRREVKP